MATLKYVGASSTGTAEVTTRSYITNILTGNLTQNQVDTAISTRLAAYASQASVDSKDALLADSAFIDAADMTRLPKTALNTPGNPFTIDSTGKLPAGLVKVSSQQKYPNTTVVGSGGGATTSGDANLSSISIPDPGYPYRLLVTGTVHAQVAADNGAYPRVSVYRTDGTLVAQGYGVAESYQTPMLGASSSRMYVNASFTPNYATAIWTPPPLLQFATTYTSDWQNLTWVGVNNDVYSTTVNGGVYMQAAATMANVAISATVTFANGVIPPDGLAPGTLTPEIRIYSSAKAGPIASSSIPGNLKQVSGTLTCSAAGVNVTKGDLFTVQARQTMFAPWGVASPGAYAQWAPTASGTANTLTLIPSLAADLSAGEISVLPTPLTSQTAITGSTVLSVRLQSPGGQSVTSYAAPSPRLTAIPIPA